MDFFGLATLITECVKCVAPQVAQCWDHSSKIDENMNTLKEKMKELKLRKEAIELRQASELVPGKTSHPEVRHWFEKVQKMEDEIKCLEQKKENVKFCCRPSLGEVVFLKISAVENLREEATFPDGLVISRRKRGEIIPTAEVLKGETTFRKHMSDILAFTKSDEVRKIGVFGMSGVGKTTVLEHINNSLVENSTFEHVIWVNAAELLDVASLQDRIAGDLEVDVLNCHDEKTRAIKILETFSTKRNYVLILDDLFKHFVLEEVGIPQPNVENGGKLLLTTRFGGVCSGMDCEKIIEMGLPPDEEATTLLLDRAGKKQVDISAVPALEKMVMDVVRECGCLPVALVAVAEKLKCYDCEDWELFLQDPKDSVTVRGSTSPIINNLKLYSYDRLNDGDQRCLLYCALYPEGNPIEVDILTHHLIAEGIIDEKKTRRFDMIKGRLTLKELIKFCLLNKAINNQGADCIKMHNLIRNMAMQITSSNPRFLIQAGKGLKSIPNGEDWSQDLEKVSLIDNNILEIPSSFTPPQCPKLSTLLLCNNGLRSIASDFFAHMKGLCVLDLSYTLIENLPRSVSDLVSLTALFLRECRALRYVPSLAELQNLRELDFYFAGIEALPIGIETLVKLKYLNLSGSRLELISDGILCKFGDLQYLSILSGCDKGPRVRAEELKDLIKLEMFAGELHDISHYNVYAKVLSSEFGPSTYILQLGFAHPHASFKYEKVVFLTNCDMREVVGPLSLPTNVEQLALRECQVSDSVRNLYELVSLDKGTELKCLEIKRCGVIEHLFSDSHSAFPVLKNLEKLDLDGLSDLGGLLKSERQSGRSSVVLPGTFGNLKEIRMFNCKSVKRLFPVASLPKLEVVTISSCEQLEEIVMSGEEQRTRNNVITLPKLRTLLLSALPTLRSIPIISDSIEEIEIWGCPKLTRIPLLDRKQPLTYLKRIDISQNVWQSLNWVDPNAKFFLQALFRTQ